MQCHRTILMWQRPLVMQCGRAGASASRYKRYKIDGM